MYYVYVLENERGWHYVGSTEDIVTRLRRHNQNSVRSTKNRGTFKIVYKEEFATRTEALQKENHLKSYKGGNALKKILE